MIPIPRHEFIRQKESGLRQPNRKPGYNRSGVFVFYLDPQAIRSGNHRSDEFDLLGFRCVDADNDLLFCDQHVPSHLERLQSQQVVIDFSVEGIGSFNIPKQD